MSIDEHGRTEPPFSADEFETLIGFLNYQRETFEWKTRNLSDEQLRHSIPPSEITLGGMLAHLAYVEDNWCGRVVGGRRAEPWESIDWRADEDADWHMVNTKTGDELRAMWRDTVDVSSGIINTLTAELGRQDALDSTHAAWGGAEHPSLRWVLVHLIEEYARHNGHADLLREAIDGETGE